MLSRNRVRKLLGVSAVVGVAATGVAVARRERAVRAYTPGQVHNRLRERYAEALATARDAADGTWGSE
ncbi:hypothetical protein [Nostocoides jenkinsii]|uniref:Secreted protein n=1 Tax=Nostocoides jenkinsii Ben 74 TaxID=1193518 RepID=A0A077MG31_9MICO|nr:hypothetical protein [Tetrasphaera jenkinsii]CCI54272.1 conserved exported hypothetical protein [Tetrasphaera jenkinsii Ben 74]